MNSANKFKKICLLIFALVMVAASAKAAPTAYAEYSDGTLTFKYGEMPTGQAYCFDVSDTGNKKAQWSELAGSINKAVFDSSFASARPKSCYDWFYDCKNLKEITGIENLNTSDVTSMYGMFLGCSSLKSLDVSGFNTSNVTDMEYMFDDCYGLTSLDLSSFNTSNVTNMQYMFSGCKRLTSLVVSGFNTSNVTNMQYMFGGCSALTSLDVSGFNTSNVTDMCGMFSGCTGLTKLDVSGFNTSNVTNMSNMFYRCYGLMSLDVGGFNTQNVTDMGNMFYLCSGLTSLDVSGFNTQNVTNMRNMFGSCKSLKSLDLSSFNTSKVTDMSSMFYGCSKLTTIYCNDTWNCYESTDMFNGCAALKGAISYNSSNIDVTYANPETGYFTKKAYELVLGGYAVSTKGEQYKAGVVEGTVTFDPSTFTLYMKDATITGGTTYGIYSKLPKLDIVVEGNCTVTSTSTTALLSERGNLTISGNGTLTLQGVT